MKTFYIIGRPVKHSLSPKLFYHIFNTLNIKAQYLYHMAPNADAFKLFLKDKLNYYKGINVTLPFKEDAYQYVNINDDSSNIIKSVNCIKNVNNELIGYNTDSYGFQKMVQQIDINLNDYNILILGNGGASKAVVHSLLSSTDNEIFIWGRNKHRVNSFIKEINSHQIKYFTQHFNKPLIIINCISLNIDENSIQTILSYLPINKIELFIDLNYFETLFSKKLIDQKCNVVLGLDMFIFQALKSFNIWFDNQYENMITYSDIKKALI